MELMKLKKLLKDIPEIAVRGSKEIEITGIGVLRNPVVAEA